VAWTEVYFRTKTNALPLRQTTTCLFFDYYFAPGSGAKYCDHRVCVSVCGSISLSVCTLAYLKSHVSKHHECFCTLSVAVDRSSSNDNAIYVHPVLWRTSRFRIMGQLQIKAWSLRRCELFEVHSESDLCPYTSLLNGR